jgi:hypothetical protein
MRAQCCLRIEDVCESEHRVILSHTADAARYALDRTL